MPSATTSKSLVRAKKNLTKFLKTLDTVPVEELEKSAQTIKAEAILKHPTVPASWKVPCMFEYLATNGSPVLLPVLVLKITATTTLVSSMRTLHLNTPLRVKLTTSATRLIKR